MDNMVFSGGCSTVSLQTMEIDFSEVRILGDLNALGSVKAKEGIKLHEGTLDLPRTQDYSANNSNEHHSDTITGTVMLSTQLPVSGGQRTFVKLINPKITTKSMIFASIGGYESVGVPIIQSTLCSTGLAVIYVANVDIDIPIPANVSIPINYLIL